MIRNSILILVVASLICGSLSIGGEPEAFHAVVTNRQSLPGGGTAIFNRVVTNIGNGYDNTTGVFTCPLPGVYVFHFSILDETDGHLMFMRLFKNSEMLADVWAQTRANQYEMAANTAIVSLQKGDEVFIKEAQRFPNTLFGDSTKRYSTFSGFSICLSPDNGIIG